MKKRLFVLSLDAMVFEDAEHLKNLPNFKKIYEGGSRVERVCSIYPTLTYPCHVSMGTGCYADKHGIFNNELPELVSGWPDWFWYSKDVKVPTVLDAAKQAGYTTAAINWPVMCGNENIDYLLPEIWSGGTHDDYRAIIRKNGANEAMMEAVENNIHLLQGKNPPAHPEFDNYAFGVFIDIYKKYRPEVNFLHVCHIDQARHSTGVFSDKVLVALDEIDAWLGKVLDTFAECGDLEDMDIVITSDHGQLDIRRSLCPNVILRDHGFIRVDENEQLAGYDAYVKSAALSGQVFLAEDITEERKAELEALLRHMCDEGIYGISRVMTAEEAEAEFHLSGGFAYVLESDGYTSFRDDWCRPIVRPLDDSDYKYGHATHGHMPLKGAQPAIYFYGPHFKKGVVIEKGEIVDQAPTYAKLLGVELPDADGTAIDAVLAL